MLSHSIKNHSSRISPSIPFTFSSTIMNNIVDSASHCLKPLSVSHKAFTYSEVPDPMLKIDMKMPYFSFILNMGQHIKKTKIWLFPNFDVKNCISTAFTIINICTNMLQMLELSAQCLVFDQGILRIYRISRPIRRTVIFFVRNLKKKNNDEYILILVIYWKKTGLLHTKINNHNIIYSSQKPRKSSSLPLKSSSWLFSLDVFKFGNNTYPWCIRCRSNLGHIFRGKKWVLWAGKYSKYFNTLASLSYTVITVH